MRMTDLSDLAVGERYARMRRRMHRRWVVALGVLLVVVAALLTVPALRAVHYFFKEKHVQQYDTLIEAHARAAGLPVALVRSVVLSESGGDPTAVSPRRARGLMQITAVTERDVLDRHPDWKQGDLFDAEYNLRIGTAYLAYLLDRFDGNIKLALTAYHMGPSAVRKVQHDHPGIEPDTLLKDYAGPQTRAYVRIVLERME